MDTPSSRADDLERRIVRLEAYTDARLVTKDVFDVWGTNIIDRLEKGENNDTWLMRFSVMALVGVVFNIIILAITQLSR